MAYNFPNTGVKALKDMGKLCPDLFCLTSTYQIVIWSYSYVKKSLTRSISVRFEWYYIRNNIVCKTLMISSLIITNFPIQQQLKCLENMILHFLKKFTYIVQ